MMACNLSQSVERLERFRKAVDVFNEVFADLDKWHAQVEGEWPDKFVVLNRFVRTGVRPPYIFND